jgi:hypothetical protein
MISSHALHRQVKGAFDALAEAADLVALASERLHHAHPGDGFFQDGGGAGQLVTAAPGVGDEEAGSFNRPNTSFYLYLNTFRTSSSRAIPDNSVRKGKAKMLSSRSVR